MKELAWREYRRNLPHWRMLEAIYFVTWRVRRDQPELSLDERMEVSSALLHFHAKQYDLHDYVVMNDHVHVIVAPREGKPLEDVIQSRKSFTTTVLRRRFSRTGSVWLDEYFDRIVRDETELDEKVRYILGNPFKRWPAISSYAPMGCWGDNY